MTLKFAEEEDHFSALAALSDSQANQAQMLRQSLFDTILGKESLLNFKICGKELTDAELFGAT